MKSPNLFVLRPVRSLVRRTRSGFALIITLSLMTLLLLLVLTLALLVQLELTTAQGTLNTAQARQNALLGAYIAIGQLQKFVGPDQRITTTADLGRLGDSHDHSTDPITAVNGGYVFPTVNTGAEHAVTPTPNPYGAGHDYIVGGTLYWTVAWGHGATPLAIYTGVDPNPITENTQAIAPMPILMNYLVSGDESTPLVVNPNGVVHPPTAHPIHFTSNAGDGNNGINGPNGVDQSKWTGLTTGITIAPSAGSSLQAAPAIVLVGPSSAGTNITTQLKIYPGNDATKFPSPRQIYFNNSLVVVPLVNITVPAEGTSNLTTGRYAWWVGDEGVKAKYNIVDPYAGADTTSGNATVAGAAGQVSRYRLRSPQRTGIERMYNMDSYATNVSNPNTYNATQSDNLLRLFDSSQILLVDQNLPGLKEMNITEPEETLQLHFHDFTPYSFGVLSDALRGGLRYDLTAAFEPVAGSTQVFNDSTNGLKGKAILPPTPSSTNTTTTEAGLSLQTLTLKNRDDGTSWHGPAAPSSATLGSSSAPVGLLWDVLQSYYAISQNNTASDNAVTMQAATSTTQGVSPVILQARLKFSEYVDQSQFQYVAVEPEFVLANPYNFPIKPPLGGLDLAFRINTNTGWEWAFHAIARNNDRVAPHGSGVGMYLGYDRTQNGAGSPGLSATAFDRNPPVLTNGYNGAYFYSLSAVTNSTPLTGALGGTGVPPGYYPFLKNPVSYGNFTAPIPGAANQAGNGLYTSALDQVAFHIPTTYANGTAMIWQPGEAKTFILADDTVVGVKNILGTNGTALQPYNARYNQLTNVNRKITAVVGSFKTSNGGDYLSYNTITPVLLQPKVLTQNQHYFFLRYTGIKSSGDQARTYNPVSGLGLTIGGTPTSDINAYVTAETWPDPQYGYISTAWPSISATLELRYDTTPTYTVYNGTSPQGGTGNLAQPTVNADTTDNGTYPALVTTPTNTSGIITGIAGDGQNVLQTITNFDLSGAGLPGKTYPISPAGYLQPGPTSYRRQFLGSTGDSGAFVQSNLGTTEVTSTRGVMPVFLTSYVMAMALPGPADKLYYAKDQANNSASDAGQTAFDPGLQVSYRTYADFNLRAKNLSLPPTAPLNPANITSVNINTPAFITSPPFGRIWNQGPDIGGSDDNIASTFNTQDDQSYNTKDLGPPLTGSFVANSPTPNTGNLGMDSPWGYSLSNTGATSAGGSGTTLTQGSQFNILYGLPSRVNKNSSAATISNPNFDAKDPYTSKLLPDIPIMSLGQLQHADATADDVWVSVGYQPGSAIGNSYSTPFVDRNSSMETKTNQSAKYIGYASGYSVGPPSRVTYNFPFASAALQNLGVYDISYMLNVALFDRYFFSTLAQGDANSILPANSRLKYATGIFPTAADLGLPPNQSLIVKDPVTNLPMFRAYAPARYMLIDGAFNVNSTSVEAWKAVLSAMRSVAYTANFNGKDATGTYPVTYFPRSIASTNLANFQLNGGRPTSMTSSYYNQPLNMGPELNPNPQSGDSFGTDPASYAGFRQLTDADIDFLARKIVQQVHLRGPFLSLAQFVNRRLTHPEPSHPSGASYDDPLSWSGALQTAIDINTNNNISNSLNNFYMAMINSPSYPMSPTSMNYTLIPADSTSGPRTTQTYPEGPAPFETSPYPKGSADPNSRLVEIPGWLTQADLLEALAPILAVRSDTFIIRTYGEVISPLANQIDLENSVQADPTLILSRAWCELVVQRVPDYVATDTKSLNDPSTTAGLNAYNPALSVGNSNPTLSPVNAAFGRRFKVVSLRWLTANDI